MKLSVYTLSGMVSLSHQHYFLISKFFHFLIMRRGGHSLIHHSLIHHSLILSFVFPSFIILSFITLSFIIPSFITLSFIILSFIIASFPHSSFSRSSFPHFSLSFLIPHKNSSTKYHKLFQHSAILLVLFQE